MRLTKENEFFDVGFIFPKNEELKKINTQIIPEDYYLTKIMHENFKGLTIKEKDKFIEIQKINYLKLVQQIILDTKLINIVLYQKGDEKNKNKVDKLVELFPD